LPGRAVRTPGSGALAPLPGPSTDRLRLEAAAGAVVDAEVVDLVADPASKRNLRVAAERALVVVLVAHFAAGLRAACGLDAITGGAAPTATGRAGAIAIAGDDRAVGALDLQRAGLDERSDREQVGGVGGVRGHLVLGGGSRTRQSEQTETTETEDDVERGLHHSLPFAEAGYRAQARLDHDGRSRNVRHSVIRSLRKYTTSQSLNIKFPGLPPRHRPHPPPREFRYLAPG